MTTSTKSESKLGKVKEKLDSFCAEGKFYEAQQLYRTIYSRLSAQRKYDESAQCAETGAFQMFKHNQVWTSELESALLQRVMSS